MNLVLINIRVLTFWTTSVGAGRGRGCRRKRRTRQRPSLVCCRSSLTEFDLQEVTATLKADKAEKKKHCGQEDTCCSRDALIDPPRRDGYSICAPPQVNHYPITRVHLSEPPDGWRPQSPHCTCSNKQRRPSSATEKNEEHLPANKLNQSCDWSQRGAVLRCYRCVQVCSEAAVLCFSALTHSRSESTKNMTIVNCLFYETTWEKLRSKVTKMQLSWFQ